MPAPTGEGSSRAVTLDIRPFEPSDAAAVWTLHNEALEATGTHVGNGPWDDDVRDPSREYQDRGGEFLVGVLAGEIVAMGLDLLENADAPRAVVQTPWRWAEGTEDEAWRQGYLHIDPAKREELREAGKRRRASQERARQQGTARSD